MVIICGAIADILQYYLNTMDGFRSGALESTVCIERFCFFVSTFNRRNNKKWTFSILLFAPFLIFVSPFRLNVGHRCQCDGSNGSNA